MGALDRMSTRVNLSSVESLKEKTFKQRLSKHYNTELISKVYAEDGDEPTPAIIQTSSLSAKIDYKKLSVPMEAGMKVGDIIHWDRESTNWLIYFRRNTEKNYFLGEMTEAQYNIKWKDQSGKVHEQLGSFTRQDPSVIKDIGYVAAYNMQYLEGTAYLLMQLNESSLQLNRYDKFVIGRATWRVVGYDETTYKNIIVFYLEEGEKNKDLDLVDLPNGQLNEPVLIESNLSGILSVKKQKMPLTLTTKRNGINIDDTYSIETNNCTLLENNVIDFYKEDWAYIKITSDRTGATIQHKVQVARTPMKETVFFIEGRDLVKTTLSYTYNIKKSINGLIDMSQGTWTIEDGNKSIKITNKTKESITIKVLDVADFTIKCTLSNGQVITKKVLARPILG